MIRRLCTCTALIVIIAITSAAQSERLVVFAAASLTDVFEEIADAFEAQHNISVVLNFAGSSTLAAQIHNGAPADIFASANLPQMTRLLNDDLVTETAVTTFAENELVLVVPAANSAMIASAADLTNDDLLLVLAAPTVPIRDYTNTLLDNLAQTFGADYPDAVLANLVSEETNVRQVLARIALDEADAGFVYRTDITEDVRDTVEIINLPSGSSPRAEYVIAPLAEARNPDAANRFIAFLQAEIAHSILAEHGFCLPTEPTSDLPSAEITETPSRTTQDEDLACAPTITLD